MNNAKILVTDDEPNILKVVCARLRTQGYAVVTAVDGEEALKQVAAEKPDLILLDIMLPKLDGFAVCEQVKLDERFKNTAIILFSAKAKTDYHERIEELGADAYIAKPFQPQELLHIIATVLAKRTKCL